MKKNSVDLETLNQELLPYLYLGYDLYFVHGWFSAYISAPSDSEDDLVIPTYLILDEDKIIDEKKFAKLIDKLIGLYSDIADSVFENNKLLRPLIDFTKPNTMDLSNLTFVQQCNLLKWLYGYLTGYLVIGGDVTEYITNEQLLEEKFFPAIFTLCIALFSLTEHVKLNFMAPEVIDDFNDVVLDLKAMWEAEDSEVEVNQLITESIAAFGMDMADIINALNDVFYVVRISDESKFAATGHPFTQHKN